LEDAWAAVNKAQKNLLAMERGLMAKFGQFLEPEYNEYDNDETPPVEQSNSKGKNINPRNWGEVDLDEEEIDAEMQKALLEAEHQRLEGVRNEIQTLYKKYKRSSRKDKKTRKTRDTTPLSKDMEKLIEDASGGRHAPTEPSASPRKEKRGDKTPVLWASNQIAPDSYLGDILGRKKRPSSRR
jgi:DNA replication initiation complex subunit (GINS family)